VRELELYAGRLIINKFTACEPALIITNWSLDRFESLEVPIASREGSWQFAEDYVGEDFVIAAARARADELGISCVSEGAGAALRFLAASVQARNVVEIGTGTGVSGLWLLRGMTSDGILTSIDIEGEHLRQAREAFAEDGIRPNRTRLITGRALDVMPRLADGAYDLVLIDGTPDEYLHCLEQAIRLVHQHGIIVFASAFGNDLVPDPAQRDPETIERRTLVDAVRDDERLVQVLLPVGDGLLAAIVN